MGDLITELPWLSTICLRRPPQVLGINHCETHVPLAGGETLRVAFRYLSRESAYQGLMAILPARPGEGVRFTASALREGPGDALDGALARLVAALGEPAVGTVLAVFGDGGDAPPDDSARLLRSLEAATARG